MSIWSGIAGAAGSLIGGLIGRDASRDAAHENRQMAGEQAQMQERFARHGIRWRVEDAKQAGIHPLYALGANTSSYSPIAIGQESDMSMANAARDMGQDVSRAISATRTADERKFADIQLRSAQADLDGKVIDNQIRAAQLQKLNSPSQVGPALPSATAPGGQGASTKIIPVERNASSGTNPHVEAGAVNTLSYGRTSSGYEIYPSDNVKQKIEDDLIGETLWHLKNRFAPTPPSPKEYPLPRGYDYWKWDMFKQEFVPAKRGSKNSTMIPSSAPWWMQP